MRAHCILHVPFEGPGYILSWIEEQGLELQTWKMYESRALPEAEDVDLLVVMGGPMNVYEEVKFPFLAGEKQLIRACIRQQRKVLGICLGAQLIADALGEKVFRNREKEIGWFPVQTRAENRDHYLGLVFPGRFVPFHWHGETFNLPAGARPLGSSGACLNQGFLYQDHVLALQFHLEITPEITEGLLKYAAQDGTAGPFVQPEREIREGLAHGPVNRAMLYALLDRFTEPLLSQNTGR
jgi:GMP synthase-like glutamine amidotransferase